MARSQFGCSLSWPLLCIVLMFQVRDLLRQAGRNTKDHQRHVLFNRQIDTPDRLDLSVRHAQVWSKRPLPVKARALTRWLTSYGLGDEVQGLRIRPAFSTLDAKQDPERQSG